MILLIPILVCFLLQVFFLFFWFRKVCVRKCACMFVSVCVSAVNIPACYIWIVNDITDANTCLFQFFCFYSVLE